DQLLLIAPTRVRSLLWFRDRGALLLSRNVFFRSSDRWNTGCRGRRARLRRARGECEAAWRRRRPGTRAGAQDLGLQPWYGGPYRIGSGVGDGSGAAVARRR